MKATVGRTVHYYSTDPSEPEAQHAAIIGNVLDEEEGTVNLMVVPRHNTSPWFRTGVKFSAEPRMNCWSWPPRSE